jgi:hypothetical protein
VQLSMEHIHAYKFCITYYLSAIIKNTASVLIFDAIFLSVRSIRNAELQGNDVETRCTTGRLMLPSTDSRSLQEMNAVHICG